jgi:hypothetical protein
VRGGKQKWCFHNICVCCREINRLAEFARFSWNLAGNFGGILGCVSITLCFIAELGSWHGHCLETVAVSIGVMA